MNPPLRHALGALPPIHEVEVDGVRLAYNDDGAGPAVVCLHAIGHGAGDYRAVSKALRGRYRVIALDWPGQGCSGDDIETASPWRYAQLLEKFVEQLGLNRFVLIGNSIGGGAALRYTAAHGQKVRGLVLCNPQGLDRQGRMAALFCKGMTRLFRAGERDASWYRRAFEFYYRQVLPAPAAAATRARMLIPQIRCPVQFCWAMRDRFIPLSRNLPAVMRFANARIEKFEQSGHSAFLEQPEHFQHVLDRFLDGLR